MSRNDKTKPAKKIAVHKKSIRKLTDAEVGKARGGDESGVKICITYPTGDNAV